MKQFLKIISLILLGALCATGLLYLYADRFQAVTEPDTALPASFKAASPGDAVITRISGEVYLIREGELLSPLPGDSVREGDIIKVVDDSWCQVRFAGTASLRLRSNTLVRIQKLLSSSRDTDIRTELLTGSMIYRVEHLEDAQNLQVIAEERIFRVQGTEFLLEALSDGATRLSVTDGRVAVLQADPSGRETLLRTLKADQGLYMTGEEEVPPEPETLTEEVKELIRMERPEEVPVIRDDLVFLEITSRPPGAKLYLNGRLNGESRLSGLFLPDNELTVLARKRGYRDETLNILPAETELRHFTIRLTPLDLEETLREEEHSAASPVEEMKKQYERDLAELRTTFEERLNNSDDRVRDLTALSREMEDDLENLRDSEKNLESRNSSLQEELEESREETEKLKLLIRQIQELADQ